MAVTVYRHPLLLLEAEELVYALVNGDAPEQLSRRGGSGLHPADAAALMALARESLDLEDADVQFLFRRYALPSYASGSHTCLARIAVFSFADWSLSGAEEASVALPDAWSWDRMVSERQIFSEIMPFGISITPQEEGNSIPFANGLTRLSIPLDFRDALLAFFSDYAVQAARLGELLLPVMTRLSNALEPFVRAAEPYLEQMERWVSASQPKDFLRDHMHLDTNLPIASLVAAPLFLVPSQVIAHLDGDAFYMLLGVGGALLEAQEPTFGSWGCQALRLLGSPVRMQMLEALSRQPQTAQELKTALDLPHLSAVMRDLSSMQTSHLLDLRYVRGRRQYRVNEKALRILAEKLLSLCEEGQTEPK